ncbi:VWA domain-containing protein [Desulfoluna spongiiphila]|uniref:Ca-activated chloride channel family protein n=1 Tax=Desulfoluna spongiiphila TaxID=419481 RepID=A0A1G5G088_9BACT|nr:VWA domain-containing protein [Desulfoluna spongiiphila]SCY44218.1 Ca-activated chloride channel family protein [Desulfoluna spongiiphila]
MLQFHYPIVFALLPLPFLLKRFLPAYSQRERGIRIPFFDELVKKTGLTPSSGAVVHGQSLLHKSLVFCAWAFLVAALARPQWVEEAVTKTVPSRDLLLAVDLSGSMETTDFKNREGNVVDRLTAVKEVLHEFLEKREGDRVGLIFFGSAAFIQAPFTEDLETCRVLLDEAQVRMAGPQTMLGDAIGLAITQFERSDMKERVLIILTDGNDTGSLVPPDKAAGIAKDNGVTIHTVAVGDPRAAGEEKLDEATLKAVAATTGGTFFHADDRDGLSAVYKRLDEMSTRDLETISHRPRLDLFQWPLGVVLIVSFLYHAASALASRAARSRRPQPHPQHTVRT